MKLSKIPWLGYILLLLAGCHSSVNKWLCALTVAVLSLTMFPNTSLADSPIPARPPKS